MARGGSRVTDLEHLRGKASNELTGLDRRLQRSITELQDYRRNVVTVLRERENPDHPLYGVMGQGEEEP